MLKNDNMTKNEKEACDIQTKILQLSMEQGEAERKIREEYRKKIEKLEKELESKCSEDFSKYIGHYYLSTSGENCGHCVLYKIKSIDGAKFVAEGLFYRGDCGGTIFMSEHRFNCAELVQFVSKGRQGSNIFIEIEKKEYKHIAESFSTCENLIWSVNDKYIKKK